MMTRNQLRAIKSRLDLAEAGPWQAQLTDDGYLRVTDNPDAVNGICGFGDMEETDAADHWNAEFIARARTDIPLLLLEIEYLQAKNAKLDKELGDCRRRLN